MSRRAGRQAKLRAAAAAERERCANPGLLGVLVDSSNRLVVTGHARGLARRDRRQVIPAEADLERAVAEHIDHIATATGRPVVRFDYRGANAT